MASTVLNTKMRRGQPLGLRQRVLSGALWVTIANVAYRGMLMLAMMMVARILGKEEYGQLGIIQSSITMFEAIAALGMGITATKHIAEYRNSDKYKVSRVITLTRVTTFVTGVFFGVVIYLIAPQMSTTMLGSGELTEFVRISALILFFNAISGGRVGILAGFEAYRAMALINSLTGTMTVLLVAGGARFYGVDGALWGLVGVSSINALLNHILSIRVMRKEGIPRAPKLTRSEWYLLWRFSVPAMTAGILYAPVNWIGGAYLVRTDGFGEMGLFAAANQWFSVLLFIPGVITSVFLPVFADHGGRGREHNLRGLLGKALKATVLVSLPLVAAVALSSSWIMRLYGEGYFEAATLLVMIALAAFVASTQNILGNALATINRMWIHFASNMVWAVVYLMTVIILVELGYKAMGLCLAILLAYFVKLLFSGVMVRMYISNGTR